jgi:hypothetical protein
MFPFTSHSLSHNHTKVQVTLFLTDDSSSQKKSCESERGSNDKLLLGVDDEEGTHGLMGSVIRGSGSGSIR